MYIYIMIFSQYVAVILKMKKLYFTVYNFYNSSLSCDQHRELVSKSCIFYFDENFSFFKELRLYLGENFHFQVSYIS